MDPVLFSLFELGLFFVLLVLNLSLFKAVQFDKIFHKGKAKEIQLIYFFTVIIFTCLLTKAFSFLIQASLQLQ